MTGGDVSTTTEEERRGRPTRTPAVVSQSAGRHLSERSIAPHTSLDSLASDGYESSILLQGIHDMRALLPQADRNLTSGVVSKVADV